MDKKIEQEYESLLAEVAIRNGSLLAPPGQRGFGWIAYDYEHLVTCGAKSWGAPIESEFSHFEDTFAEDVKVRHAIDVADVTCNCGQITGGEVRWEPYEGVSEVARAVFGLLYEKLRKVEGGE